MALIIEMRSALSRMTPTTAIAPNLKTDFKNSTKPWPPKRRFQPAAGETRDHCGRMRSSTRLGVF